MIEKILNTRTPYGKIRASHEGSLHSSTLNTEGNKMTQKVSYSPPHFIQIQYPMMFVSKILNDSKISMKCKMFTIQ